MRTISDATKMLDSAKLAAIREGLASLVPPADRIDQELQEVLPALRAARDRGVSYQAIREYLIARDLRVSMHRLKGALKKRRKTTQTKSE